MPEYGATDRVRQRAALDYIEPARRSGASRVQIHSGAFNKHLVAGRDLPANRLPIVCNALSSRKFQRDNYLSLESVDGPPSGRSSTVVYTFRLEPLPDTVTQPSASVDQNFLSLRGALKATYKRLGGADKFHKAQRQAWDQ